MEKFDRFGTRNFQSKIVPTMLLTVHTEVRYFEAQSTTERREVAFLVIITKAEELEQF